MPPKQSGRPQRLTLRDIKTICKSNVHPAKLAEQYKVHLATIYRAYDKYKKLQHDKD